MEVAVTRRDRYNVIKGVMIYFVVCMHVIFGFYTAETRPFSVTYFQYLVSMAVPMFMIMGGYFLATKLSGINEVSIGALTALLLSLLSRLLVPYYIFLLIYVLVVLVRGGYIPVEAFLLIDVRFHGLYFVIIYVYSYVFVLLVFGLLRYSCFQGDIVLSTMIPVLSLLFFPLTSVAMGVFPDNIVVSKLTYIVYFSAGLTLYFVRKKVVENTNFRKMVIPIFLCMLTFAYTLILIWYKNKVDYVDIIGTTPPTVFRLIYIIIIFMLVQYILSKFVFMVRFAKYLSFEKFGSESLFIFLLHPYLLSLVLPIVKTYLGEFWNSSFMVVAVAVLGYLLVMISWQVYKMLPSSCQKLF